MTKFSLGFRSYRNNVVLQKLKEINYNMVEIEENEAFNLPEDIPTLMMALKEMLKVLDEKELMMKKLMSDLNICFLELSKHIECLVQFMEELKSMNFVQEAHDYGI
ncbi:uncharacterized protein LOC124460657 [Drosophila willistoni]|uniref:uncharacterized protein LOC124460657 n=1 Tax=Drosophila willistoni TaxID=7260 RepID=UPI001F07D918|nr:uncharacterized protein LOC124460657 [Drosophila willistoni]